MLHLIPDAPAAVAEWARVLRPGGRAITATFAAVDPTQHGGAEHGGGSTAPHADHGRFRTPALVGDLLAGAGLSSRRHEFWTHGGDTVLIAEFAKPRE